MNPRISVVISSHQGERDISHALLSVLDQTYGEFEIIVVDDGSTDGTARIVEAHALVDPRVRLLTLPHNRGPSVGRNAGLEQCRGQWVALLDADDAYAPRRLEALLEWAESTGADMVSDSLYLVSYPDMVPMGTAPRPPIRPPGRFIGVEDYLYGNDFSSGSLSYGYLKPMIRRDFLRSHGIWFRDNLRLCEDFHFYLDCLFAGAKWWLLPDAHYYYAVRRSSLSRKGSPDAIGAAAMHSAFELTAAGLPNVARYLLKRRHNNIERTIAYLRARKHAKRMNLVGAFRELARRPDLVAMVRGFMSRIMPRRI
ncbi:MAG TPA: glycosyltransferase [Magnetospirillum sp.]|jgi:succinoglycan biosynthesis protein ExoO/succinoglycan biosynthesis protein ExoU|nr:glycosyltransferase [Magnetospirillum sp.]